jgi:rhamnosyltransferase
VPIPDFSHGRSRNLGARESRGEFVAMLSQDALPADRAWLRNLLAPFADPAVAATYSRQVPRDDASPMERYFLLTHFPPGPAARREARPGAALRLADVFFSNVSSAVRRSALLAHPFDEALIMSEDQQLSRDLLQAGYAVAYAPESIVVHSHRYSLRTCFRRYFDSVYSLTVVFPAHGVGVSAGMGLRYLGGEAMFVARTAPLWLPYYALYTFAKTAGTLAGHFAERMPRWLLKRLSLHSYHWNAAPPAAAKPGAGPA